jgi:hypothetical protein
MLKANEDDRNFLLFSSAVDLQYNTTPSRMELRSEFLNLSIRLLNIALSSFLRKKKIYVRTGGVRDKKQ